MKQELIDAICALQQDGALYSEIADVMAIPLGTVGNVIAKCVAQGMLKGRYKVTQEAKKTEEKLKNLDLKEREQEKRAELKLPNYVQRANPTLRLRKLCKCQ